MAAPRPLRTGDGSAATTKDRRWQGRDHYKDRRWQRRDHYKD
eukprot:gene18847-45257_t